MITRLRGKLVSVDEGKVMLRVEALTYELLVPAADVPLLLDRIGQQIEFHTMHYLEGQSQGSSFIPRLIGFSCDRDRDFFQLFTTVKGIGNRKALRALVRPLVEIAAAIASRDLTSLTSLPEIGKRSAETIVAELSGKVDAFVGDITPTVDVKMPPFGDDAIAMLVQLGESRRDARKLVELAMDREPTIETADQLVQTSFQLRGSI
ncbi:MAG: Holliday junction branch migration protein RuvA [Phycisphaerales bacterium]|nr:Holliday junction branch migration protein RuvA [Phycisphaerales bacterium]MDP6693096.1 Holliday junction branch migration protein RuvA [Phycisphaerales bacterium]